MMQGFEFMTHLQMSQGQLENVDATMSQFAL